VTEGEHSVSSTRIVGPAVPGGKPGAAAAWAVRADDLARWAWGRLVNRVDVWGAYTPPARRGKKYTKADGTEDRVPKSYTAPARKDRGRVTLTGAVLARHFRGAAPEHVIGLHSTSPDNTSRWGRIDIDWHDEAAQAPAANLSAAMAWHDRLREEGFRPLLTDSNGAGGYHLGFLLARPAPTADVFAFLRSLTADHARHGIPAQPETFPKQRKVAPLGKKGQYGNWLRLPGRHHTLEHWTRAWDGAAWLEGADAVAWLLSFEGDDPALLPPAPPRPGRGVPPDGAPGPRRRSPFRAAATGDARRAYALAALRGECGIMANTPRGSLNNQLNKSAFALGQLVQPGGLFEREGLDALRQAARLAGCDDPHKDEDTMTRAFEDGMADPRDLSGVGAARGRHRVDGQQGGGPDAAGAAGRPNVEAVGGLGAGNDTAGGAPAGGGGAPPEVVPVGGAAEGRPSITVSTEERDVNDAAVAALAREPALYQRANRLVRVLRDEGRRQRLNRPAGSPYIAPLPAPTLREMLAANAVWQKWQTDRRRKGELKLVRARPPEWAVSALLERGAWPGVRHLSAVVEVPVPRPDGTVLDRPGWDEATGLLYEPNGHFPALAPAPGREDATRAADALLDLVADFPFVRAEHSAAWLAAVLTPFARFAVEGPCPLFVSDASAAGSGKSLLLDLIGWLYTGRDMPRTNWPGHNEEMRKTVTAIALAGDKLVMLDNLGSALGSSALDAALTATVWKDRVLGKSEMTAELPLFAVWFASGNNVTLRGDTHRRVVPWRLEPQDERPEERGGFRIPDLRAHVLAHRGALVAAALTVLRAHALAGRPSGDLRPLGSYEAWCRVVRAAVWWATGYDPCATRGGLAPEDRGEGVLCGLIEGWSELPGGTDGLTAAEALDVLRADAAAYATLRHALRDAPARPTRVGAQGHGRAAHDALAGQPAQDRAWAGGRRPGDVLTPWPCPQPAVVRSRRRPPRRVSQ
jgi:hypothetical protein